MLFEVNMKNKEQYRDLDIEIVELSSVDIIKTSGTITLPEDKWGY